ncbi:MAG TPA: Ig-like domain-containing protein, partial [Chitinophagales bacterium]|nr:Ig-like domain-containing protein [Chitinophagales bacterium]
MGPGLGNLTYSGSELFKPVSALSALNGAPLGHGHAMMFKGYLALILANDSGKKGGGFGFYDMSDPRNPQAVLYKVDQSTEKIREGHGYGFFRVNGRDYCALQTIEGIQIWDWTDITNPYMASNLMLPGVLESDYASGSWWVAVQAPYLFVAGSSNGFYVVDASVPAAPALIKQVPISQTGNFRVGPIFAIGNLLVITSMDALGIATLNISDPANPVLLDTDLNLNTFMYSAMVNGNYLISASKDNRVHLWDISTGNLNYVGGSPVMSGGGGYVNYQDGFVHAGMSDDYYKLDMRNPNTITIVGSATSPLPNTDHDFASVLGNLVMVGNDHGTGSAIVVHDIHPDTIPPSVTRVIPASDAVNQALTTRIGITMSDGIEYASIDEESFIVRPFGGQPLEGTYSYQFGILNFTPKNPLDPNKVYEVVLPAGGIRDYAGNAIADEFVSKFSTGSTLTPIGCSLREAPFVELGLASFFEVTPFNNDSSATTYTWDFGDGTTSGPSPIPFANHIYQNVGRYTVLVTIHDGVSQSTCNISHTVHEKISANGPSQATTILLDATGDYLWNVNPDNNTLTKTKVNPFEYFKEATTGKTPVSLAQDGSGNIWVLNKGDATLQIFDSNGNLSQTISLPRGSLPFALAISPDKQKAFISLHATGQVLKMDVAGRSVEALKQVASFVKGIAVSRDNRQLFVTRFITEADSGEVYMLDAASLDVLKIIKLAPDQSTDSEFGGKGIPNYLNSITLSPDSRIAVVPAKKDNIFRGLQRDGNALNFENTVRPMLGLINLVSREEDYNARIDINNGDVPAFTIFSRFGNLIFASLQGNDRVDVFDAYRGSFLNSIEDVGSAPQGLTLSRTGDTLFVHNFLSRTVSAYNMHDIVNQISAQITKVGEVSVVRNETMDALVLKGKKIFYNAKDERMNKDSYMSCATCHLDGDNDGRVWDLTQLGEGIRNTIPLNGRAGAAKGAVHWTGNFDEIQDFEGQIRALAGGKGFMHDADFYLGSHSQPLGDKKTGLSDELDALAAYISSLNKFGDSPYRDADGSLTEAGKRGKIV